MRSEDGKIDSIAHVTRADSAEPASMISIVSHLIVSVADLWRASPKMASLSTMKEQSTWSLEPILVHGSFRLHRRDSVQGSVGGEDGVVRLNHTVAHGRRRVDTELKLRLLSVVERQLLQEERAEARPVLSGKCELK